MAVNVDKLLETIESQLDLHIDERCDGYRVRLSQTIERLLQAEQAWRRDRTPVNPEFVRECRETGSFLMERTSDQD